MENTLWLSIVVLLYLAIIGYLAYQGFRATHNTADYLIAGRKMHPFVMAMSYGATFISTSAIVGFGGAAAVFGLGILWLTVLNIFVGIFIAFVFFGGRTRKMGRHLDAHTFPEFLGKRYESRFIQVFVGMLIIFFMPLYTSVILMGAAKFLQVYLVINYDVALFFFSVIVFLYVMMGGLKGVMYTDAFQGSIMLFGMLILLGFTYYRFGGVIAAHEALTAVEEKAVAAFGAAGSRGWTRMPEFGSVYWWTLISTIVMGVGIGVLAQPQLVVRFMTVRSQRELNRAVLVGGVFILFMTGVAFVVGALTNLFFLERDGVIAIAAAKGNVEEVIPMYITGAMPTWFGAVFMVTLLAAAMSTASSQFHTMGTAIGRDIIEPVTGMANSILINRVGIFITFIISLVLAWALPLLYHQHGEAIIARGTAIFFGLCASTFLPAYIGALYSRRVTRTGAIAGMLTGFISSAFWLVFMHSAESQPLLICNALFGRPSLVGTLNEQGKVVSMVTGFIRWADVDPLFIALPLAVIVTIIVTARTRPPEPEQLRRVGMV